MVLLKMNINHQWTVFLMFFNVNKYFRCWDINTNAAIWWVIKGPVLASIMVLIIQRFL